MANQGYPRLPILYTVSEKNVQTLKRYSSKQEAQLPQRDSASATHVFLGSLTDRALH